ncbi:monovalent cation/H+ antiporter complex subunit F [Streptomyces sp. NPDC051322]|uniref:monovalent cation/H+ antiporter complex subunit F n=1 Tax=Streptomyces sp. NPDC051322 TaxID=3154645 RepID=UPI00344FDD06
MNPWLLGTIVLLVGGFCPAAWLGTRGDPVDRLVGLEIGSVVASLLLVLLSQALGQPSYLIVPLVMVLLSFAGTLVFTRLLVPRAPDS